jgi:hypothetical protein
MSIERAVVLPGLHRHSGLEFCSAAVPEPGSHSEECLLVPGRLPRAAQPEESVVLHSTLPQVLAALLRGQSAHVNSCVMSSLDR